MCNVCTFDRVTLSYCGDHAVSMASLWKDNLICEITFLYFGVSCMSRHVYLPIVVLICLYRRMDVHVFRPVCQCVITDIYISRDRCLSNGINMVSFTDSGKHQTSLKPLFCNLSLTCFSQNTYH